MGSIGSWLLNEAGKVLQPIEHYVGLAAPKSSGNFQASNPQIRQRELSGGYGQPSQTLAQNPNPIPLNFNPATAFGSNIPGGFQSIGDSFVHAATQPIGPPLHIQRYNDQGIGNKIGNFGLGLLEGAANSPRTMAEGVQKVSEGIALPGRSNQILPGVGQYAQGVLEGPANLLGAGKAAELAAKGVKQSLGSAVKEGAKFGGLYGGAYGASSSTAQGQDPFETASNTVISGLAGAGLGLGTPLASRAVSKGLSGLVTRGAHDLTHATTTNNLSGILDQGQINPSPVVEQGGKPGVSLGTKDWASSFNFNHPDQPNAHIVFKGTPEGTVNHGVESTHPGPLKVTPDNVRVIRVPDDATALSVRSQGFKAEVDPTLAPHQNVPGAVQPSAVDKVAQSVPALPAGDGAAIQAHINNPNSPLTPAQKEAFDKIVTQGRVGGGMTGPGGSRIDQFLGGETPRSGNVPQVGPKSRTTSIALPGGKEVPAINLGERGTLPATISAANKGDKRLMYRPELADAAQQPTSRVEINATTHKGVIGQVSTTMAERTRLYNEAVIAGNKLGTADKAKLSDAINGENVGKADKPKQFQKAIDAARKANDYSLAADRAAGSTTRRFNGGKFSPLYFRADPAAMDRLGIPEDQRFQLGDGTQGFSQGDRTTGELGGYRAGTRQYRSYKDAAEQTGGILQPLNKSAVEDLTRYHNGGQGFIRDRLLFTHLQRLYPDQISDLPGNGLVPAAHGELPFFVSKELNRRLEGFKSNKFSNPFAEAAAKIIEAPLRLSRKIAFLGAPIHYANLSEKAAALTLPSGHIITGGKAVATSLASSTHPEVYRLLQRSADQTHDLPGFAGYSTREYARSLGIPEAHTEPDLLGKGTDIKGKIDQLTPFGIQYRNLARFNNVLGWRLAERVQQLGIDPHSPQGQAIGSELTRVIDRINPQKEGLNPMVQRFFTAGSIAPNWIRTNISLTRNAITKTLPLPIRRTLADGTHQWGTTFDAKTGFGLSNAGDIARTTVFGGRLLLGAATVIGSAIVAGEMPTLQHALNEAGFNPNNPVPNVDTGAKNPKGQPVVTNVPTDTMGLGLSLLTNPQHFGIARETPLISAVSQTLQNKDWAGNELVDKSQPGWQSKLAVKGAESLLPFSAQGLTNKKMTTDQQVASLFGLRTHRDPNDPNYQSSLAYVKAMANATNGASQPDQNTIKEYMSRQVDSNGNKVSNGTVGGRADAILLMKNAAQGGQALQRIYDAEHGLSNPDPLWKLPLTAPAGKASVSAYLQREAQYQGPEKTGLTARLQSTQNPWIDQLGQARKTYYDRLGPSSSSPAKEPPYPTLDASTQAQLKAYDSVAPAQKGDFLRANPGVTDAFSQISQWTNQIRKLEGAPPVPQQQQASPQLQAVMDQYNSLPKGTGARSGWIKANPQAWGAMTTYLANQSMGGLLKNAVQSVYSGTNNQTLLKDVRNVGQYDISQNPDGTYGFNSGLSNSGSSGYGNSRGGTGPGSSRGGYIAGKGSVIKRGLSSATKVSIPSTKVKLSTSKTKTQSIPMMPKVGSNTGSNFPNVRHVKRGGGYLKGRRNTVGATVKSKA